MLLRDDSTGEMQWNAGRTIDMRGITNNNCGGGRPKLLPGSRWLFGYAMGHYCEENQLLQEPAFGPADQPYITKRENFLPSKRNDRPIPSYQGTEPCAKRVREGSLGDDVNCAAPFVYSPVAM